jgi:hypothetical protein
MRLAGCLLIEVVVAAGLLTALGLGGVRAVTTVHAMVEARRAAVMGGRSSSASPPKALALRPREDLSAETADVEVEATGTFLGMSDELLLDRLRTQPVTRLKVNHGGSSLSFRVDFSDGSRAAWKPAQTNSQTVPRKEVAAYRINRLLGLNAVPPATSRSLSREELFGLLHPDSMAAAPRIRAETIMGPNGTVAGEASYWIPVIKDSVFDTPEGHLQMAEWLTQGTAVPFEQRAFAAQVAVLVVFDFLIANPDRYSGGNMKTSGDGAQLFFMDNTMSFFLDPEGPEKTRAVLTRTQRFSRGFQRALARVDVPTLHRLLRDPDGTEVLTDAEIRAVVRRREFIERHVAALIAQFGDKDVLYFP